MTIDAGRVADIPVSMCGEMAGDVRYTRILLALGLREFSMDPTALMAVKQQIRTTDIGRLKLAVDALLQSQAPSALRELVAQINR